MEDIVTYLRSQKHKDANSENTNNITTDELKKIFEEQIKKSESEEYKEFYLKLQKQLLG